MKKLTLFLSSMLLACATNLWATQYKLVTTDADLEAGANYIIGSAASGSAVFMSTANNENNRKQSGSVKITNSEITLANDILVLKLGGSTGSWTFATTNYAGTAGYLNATNTTSRNYLKVVTANDNYNKFTITFDAQNAAVITCTGKTSRNIMRYNSDNSVGQLFSCYSSGQSAVYLYKEVTSAATLTSIEIAGEPTKTTYMAGDEFSTDGLKVMGNYDNDTQKEITTGITWEVTPKTLTAEDTSVEVKATVGEKTATRTIEGLTVTAPKTLTSIAISGEAETTNYYAGQTFDPAGLVVMATFEDESTADVTELVDWTFDPDVLEEGTTTVSVSATYKELNAAPVVVTVTVGPAPKVVTIDLTKDETTTATEEKLEWEGTILTITSSRTSSSTTAANNYYPGTAGKTYTSTRFYKNNTLTFTPADGITLGTITYTATSKDYATAMANSEWTNATATAKTEATTYIVTITPTDGTKAITATIGGTTGGTSFVINYSGEASPTVLDNAIVETPAVKTIENGQLVIIRDGVKYNAMGVRLQ